MTKIESGMDVLKFLEGNCKEDVPNLQCILTDCKDQFDFKKKNAIVQIMCKEHCKIHENTPLTIVNVFNTYRTFPPILLTKDKNGCNKLTQIRKEIEDGIQIFSGAQTDEDCVKTLSKDPTISSKIYNLVTQFVDQVKKLKQTQAVFTTQEGFHETKTRLIEAGVLPKDIHTTTSLVSSPYTYL